MEKTLLKKFLIMCMVSVLWSLSAGQSFASKVEKRLEELSQQEAEYAENALAAIERPTAEYKAEAFRDPFVPLLKRDDSDRGDEFGGDADDSFVKDLSVSGIIVGGKFPQAIINRQVVKVGDMIGEAKVLEIKKEGVTLYYKSNNIVISSPAFAEAKRLSNKGGSNE
jgi:sRNA-binding protein